jgi:hypothetical protein
MTRLILNPKILKLIPDSKKEDFIREMHISFQGCKNKPVKLCHKITGIILAKYVMKNEEGIKIINSRISAMRDLVRAYNEIFGDMDHYELFSGELGFRYNTERKLVARMPVRNAGFRNIEEIEVFQ